MDAINPDEILASYLAEPDDRAAEILLRTLLVDFCAPYVRMIVTASLRGPRQAESGDAAQDVLLDLTCRLRQLREHTEPGGEPPIRNLRAYIASVARRGAGLVLRRSNPDRSRLINRLRYCLKSNPALRLVEDAQGRWLAEPATGGSRLADIPVPSGAASMPLPDLIGRILAFAAPPVLLTDLTDYIGSALGGFAREESFEAAVTVEASNLAVQMEQRAWLAHLWNEIVELPVNQRVALLLNLRDHIGDSALRVLPTLGIASIRQVAAALEMQPEKLAGLWLQLPVDDLQIAAMLSLTRQQVANLRKSARDRLIRRMGIRK